MSKPYNELTEEQKQEKRDAALRYYYSINSTDERKAIRAARAREKRSQESPEQRESRLEYMKEYNRKYRPVLSEEEKIARREERAKSKARKTDEELLAIKNKHRIKQNAWRQARLNINRDRVNSLKASTPCTICGQLFHPVVMDFHHTDPNEKEHNIARMIHCKNWDEIEEEISKCIIVCSNCHRLIHH